MEIAFTLPVDPMSIQFAGKRVMVRAGRPVFFKQKRASNWDALIARLSAPYLPAQPFTGALYMDVIFVIRRPQALMGKKHPPERNCVWVLRNITTNACRVNGIRL